MLLGGSEAYSWISVPDFFNLCSFIFPASFSHRSRLLTSIYWLGIYVTEKRSKVTKMRYLTFDALTHFFFFFFLFENILEVGNENGSRGAAGSLKPSLCQPFFLSSPLASGPFLLSSFLSFVFFGLGSYCVDLVGLKPAM